MHIFDDNPSISLLFFIILGFQFIAKGHTSVNYGKIQRFDVKRMEGNSLAIAWFRNDLRIHDHPMLHQIATNKHKQVLCIYWLDIRLFPVFKNGLLSPYYLPATLSCRRTQFLLQSLENLRSNLSKLNQKLFISTSTVASVLDSLKSTQQNEIRVYVQEDIGLYEERMIEEVSMKGIDHQRISVQQVECLKPLYSIQTLPFDKEWNKLPESFTQYRKTIEKLPESCLEHLQLMPKLDIDDLGSPLSTESMGSEFGDQGYDYLPTLSELGYTMLEIDEMNRNMERGVLHFHGGEDSGIERLQKWIFEDDNLKDYINMRNGMMGEKYSSKFSPWLALGCLSPRLIYHEVKRYEREKDIVNPSTLWFISQLLVRDYYYYTTKKHSNSIFRRSGILGYKLVADRLKHNWRDIRDNQTMEWIERWKNGQIGIPIIDANMRELRMTGYMSNRGRQIVASYFIWDLEIDWRIGAIHFERHLLDYDISSNYGSWNSVAGLISGRINRFHITQQAKDYDPTGSYVRYWIPELQTIPSNCPFIHEPWKLSIEDQEVYNLRLGIDYNYPPKGIPLPPDIIEYDSKTASNQENKRSFKTRKNDVGNIKPYFDK